MITFTHNIVKTYTLGRFVCVCVVFLPPYIYSYTKAMDCLSYACKVSSVVLIKLNRYEKRCQSKKHPSSFFCCSRKLPGNLRLLKTWAFTPSKQKWRPLLSQTYMFDLDVNFDFHVNFDLNTWILTFFWTLTFTWTLIFMWTLTFIWTLTITWMFSFAWMMSFALMLSSHNLFPPPSPYPSL